MPSWQVFMNERPEVVYFDNEQCSLGSLDSWKGRWNDVTIFANYRQSNQEAYFQLFKNGELLCNRTSPIVDFANSGRRFETYLKYGVYQAFVSRHLSGEGSLPEGATPYNQALVAGGFSSSPTNRPFDFEWGVELPTQVVYFDEMLASQRSREAVDVRMRESAQLPPVD